MRKHHEESPLRSLPCSQAQKSQTSARGCQGSPEHSTEQLPPEPMPVANFVIVCVLGVIMLELWLFACVSLFSITACTLPSQLPGGP